MTEYLNNLPPKIIRMVDSYQHNKKNNVLYFVDFHTEKIIDFELKEEKFCFSDLSKIIENIQFYKGVQSSNPEYLLKDPFDFQFLNVLKKDPRFLKMLQTSYIYCGTELSLKKQFYEQFLNDNQVLLANDSFYKEEQVRIKRI